MILFFSSAIVYLMEIGNTTGRQGSTERAAFIMGTGNPPIFMLTPPDPQDGSSGVPIEFQIAVSDPDNDILNVTWDWGDGSIDTNQTPPAQSFQFVITEHTYYPGPYGDGSGQDYTLNISLDDGNGNIVWSLSTVIIARPYNYSPKSPQITVDPMGSKIRVNPGDLVTIVANSSDPEGDALNWTYKFSESGSLYDVMFNHTDATAPGEVVWNNVSCTFSAIGIYTVVVNISDAPYPYDLFPHNVSEDIEINVVANVAPMTGSLIFVDPSSPVVRSEVGYELVNFTLQAADDDGDDLIATWDFDDGTPPVVQTSPGGTNRLRPFVVQRNYTDVGFYNVSVTVTDSVPGHEISLTVFVQVNSTNRPPTLSLAYNLSAGSYALSGEIINFTLVFTDPEGNPVYVMVDFGDNSTILDFFLTDMVENNVTLKINHSYAKLGNYAMVIWYTDNKTGLFDHQRQVNVSLEIDAPSAIVTHTLSWWDYTSLGLFCMIPVLVAVRFVQMSRRRKAIEEQGMTYDEWRLRKSVDEELLSSKKEGGP